MCDRWKRAAEQARFPTAGRHPVFMKIALALALGCLATAASAATPSWRLVWSDEFEYTGRPDPAKWDYETGFLRNGEAQYYTSRLENARVEQGVLVVEARKERYHLDGPEASRTTADYTAASVITKGKASWQYGRIEVRAKIPSGRGIWPAIWMLGTDIDQVDWPRCGEIDIMEYVGWMPDTIHGNLHNPARIDKRIDPVRLHMQASITVPKPEAAFHVYALEWDASLIRIFYDDQPYLTCPNPGQGADTWPYDHPFYLLLNVAIGGTWGGERGIDDAIFPQRMEVDYVRVYERNAPAASPAAK